ncbi:muramidase-2-like [Paramacrobiotus metropolitanus]|uniref:muramidase-2-like n=1 Tax=Paramacrobiotus metropolitanus TaxID=2943436 RepID=UPI0024459E90|nr:muramidase-2-like [Paramacrobiotus metropolitanus]
MSKLLSAAEFDRTLEAINRPTRGEQYPFLLQAIQDAGIGSRAELALFLANIYHESEGLQYVAEIGGGAGKGYEGGDKYYGRGYIQLTHIYNYRDASQAIFGDKTVLERNPERVEQEPQLAWGVTAWFWKARVKPMGVANLEQTVRAINSNELKGYNPALERRYQFLEAISQVLGTGADAGVAGKKSLHKPLPTGGTEYIVKAGDSLWEIGQKHGVDYHQIASDNNIPDPTLIHPGMKLIIKGTAAPAGGSASGQHPGGNASRQSPAGGETTYVVKAGDSLWEIGQKFGTTFQQIASDNNIPDPTLIHPGMKLVIRGSPTAAGSAPPTAGGRPSAGGGEKIHVVQPGDTLYVIGQKYGVNFLQIAADNQIADPNVIFPGMKLRIGGGQAAQGSAPVAGGNGGRGPAPSAGGRQYTVRPGDSLWEIGQKHGVDYHQIAEVNKIADPTKIFPGQVLNIP